MGKISKNPVAVFLFSFFLQYFVVHFGHAATTIAQGQSIRDGDSLISDDEIFELGFFSPENSTLRYLGIWYHKIDVKTVVWVANRDKPISDKTGVLKIGNDGNLVVFDGKNSSVWSSKATIGSKSNNISAIIMDTGNFILSDPENIGDTSKAYWQSFDHPTDTYLPGMKAPVNPAAGRRHYLFSWKSVNDPSPGNYSLGVDLDGSPQIVLWEGERRRWRSGQWNSLIFTGVPNMSALTNYLYGFKLSPPDQNGTMYFTYNPSKSSDLLRFKISSEGKEEQFSWNDERKEWTSVQSQPANECELYNHCGKFGVCNILDSNKCSCIDGYQARFPDQWNGGNWSGGCERRTPLPCQRNDSSSVANGEDGFKGIRCMKLPDFESLLSLENSETCRGKCSQNCSCSAYAEVSGIGCMIWTGDLVDIQHFNQGGSLFYLRLANSEFGKKKISNLVIIIVVVIGTFLLGISIWLVWRFKKELKVSAAVSSISCFKDKDTQIINMSKSREFSTDLSGSVDFDIEGNQVNVPELPMFSFNSVVVATNNFSEENKLGQGGFGPVYKGKLPGGQEIAVKRLSGKSCQGLEELTNEIKMIAKLQHRNLVRLLGCCIQGEEKMLVYEYMPNKSLDFFLFDEAKQALLDWKKRFTIIQGIARGLLYLHRDSRLRIIHRDLKASNILLDAEMNPKISDFGMARMFGGNQNEANTVRVVGTYGYMSPEYAMEGLFSVKSDVYSLGVLLLEILSCQRNTSFRLTEHSGLIRYAWYLWNQGRSIDLVDPSIRDSNSQKEVLRCIHVAMLCVQDSALNRPNMAAVMLMLESETPILQMPKQPTYTSMRSSIDTEFSLEGQEILSSNSITVTTVVGR